MSILKQSILQLCRKVAHAIDTSVANNTHTTAQITTLAQNQLLAGRLALVTGGSSGIGLAIAEAFINSGASVVICGRSDERNKKALEKIKQGSGASAPVDSITMDTKDCASFSTAIENIAARFGRPIDILVNNAGILGGGIRLSSPEEFDNVLSTNLRGAFYLSKEVAKHMIQNKVRGNILNITSSSALRPANSAYSLSKWGMRGLTLGLAKSLIPHGIVVNAIAPGPTATPMLNTTADELTHTRLPNGRYALPEEIAGMAVILTSNMSRCIVGDTVYMTGGAGLITYEDVGSSFYSFP